MVDTQLVIDLYESGLSASDIAKKLNCSGETVRKKLRKAGYDLNKLRKKYCPALVVMLRTVGNMRFTDICSLLGMSSQSVNSIIRRAGLADKKRRRGFDLDEIEREYLAGASTYALGEKYGVCRQTITKWMKKRGHVRGKGYMPEQSNHPSGSHKGHETQRIRAIEKVREKALNDSGGTIELKEWHDQYNIEFKCLKCGNEFIRCRSKHPIVCPECKKREYEKQRQQRIEDQKRREAERLAESQKEKICPSCGSAFHSEYKTKIYCSGTCARREKRRRDVATGKAKLRGDYGNHRKRARIHGVAYEPGITVEKLVKRDGNICQICGEPCDANDLRWGYSGPLYPSIDHIVAMANGGGHTWDNVQLAHIICNSNKRDLLEEELTEEVITHAKEQAIAYKCA